MRRKKRIFIIILIVTTLILGIMNHKGYFLPKAQIGMKYAHWNNRDYHMEENNDWYYEPDGCVAKNEWGYYLYSLKGDKNKSYHTLYPSIIDGYHGHPVYIESDYQIPTAGIVTGIIITENGPSVWETKFVKQKKVVKLLQVLMNDSDTNLLKQEKNVTNADVYSIYLCFENCPVSGKFAGHIVKYGEEYIVITGNKHLLTYESAGNVKINKGVNYTVIQDNDIKKEIDKIVALLRYRIES